MAIEMKKVKAKKAPTPRQLEIKRLRDKGREARSDQENARLDQLAKEERRDRFLRLASKRVNNALAKLRNVERMANKSVYDYSPEEAAKIAQALQVGFDALVSAFASTKKASACFSL